MHKNKSSRSSGRYSSSSEFAISSTRVFSNFRWIFRCKQQRCDNDVTWEKILKLRHSHIGETTYKYSRQNTVTLVYIRIKKRYYLILSYTKYIGLNPTLPLKPIISLKLR